MSEHTPGPWRWRQFGEWYLTGEHSMRPIVLGCQGDRPRNGGAPRPSHFVVRNEQNLLVPFEWNHPDVLLIAAAPELRALADSLMAFLQRHEEALYGIDHDIPMAAGATQLAAECARAIAKAEGRQ